MLTNIYYFLNRNVSKHSNIQSKSIKLFQKIGSELHGFS